MRTRVYRLILCFIALGLEAYLFAKSGEESMALESEVGKSTKGNANVPRRASYVQAAFYPMAFSADEHSAASIGGSFGLSLGAKFALRGTSLSGQSCIPIDRVCRSRYQFAFLDTLFFPKTTSSFYTFLGVGRRYGEIRQYHDTGTWARGYDNSLSVTSKTYGVNAGIGNQYISGVGQMGFEWLSIYIPVVKTHSETRAATTGNESESKDLSRENTQYLNSMPSFFFKLYFGVAI